MGIDLESISGGGHRVGLTEAPACIGGEVELDTFGNGHWARVTWRHRRTSLGSQ